MEKNELILINRNEFKPELVFLVKGAPEKMVEEIRKKAFDFVADVNTKEGRQKIASQGNLVARSKTFLDDAGADLKEKPLLECRLIDKDRKYIRDECDKIKEEVRKPLTDFENAEMERARAEAKKAEDARLAEEAKKKAEQEEKERKFREEQAIIKKQNEEKEKAFAQQQAEIDRQKKEIEDAKKIQDAENARIKADNERLKAQEQEQAREKIRSTRTSVIVTKNLHGFQDSSIDLARVSERDFSEYLSNLENKKIAFDQNQKKLAEENEKYKKENDKRIAEQKKIDDENEAKRIAQKKIDDALAKDDKAFDLNQLSLIHYELMKIIDTVGMFNLKTANGNKLKDDVNGLLSRTLVYLNAKFDKMKAE